MAVRLGWTDCHIFVSYFLGFQNICHSVCFWPTALKLAIWFVSSVDKIKFMLLNKSKTFLHQVYFSIIVSTSDVNFSYLVPVFFISGVANLAVLLAGSNSSPVSRFLPDHFKMAAKKGSVIVRKISSSSSKREVLESLQELSALINSASCNLRDVSPHIPLDVLFGCFNTSNHEQITLCKWILNKLLPLEKSYVIVSKYHDLVIEGLNHPSVEFPGRCWCSRQTEQCVVEFGV